MEQTAVEFYAEQEVKLTLDFLANKINQVEYGIKRVKLIEQAQEKFEKQIINAYDDGYSDSDNGNIINKNYYNQTFKSE